MSGNHEGNCDKIISSRAASRHPPMNIAASLCVWHDTCLSEPLS